MFGDGKMKKMMGIILIMFLLSLSVFASESLDYSLCEQDSEGILKTDLAEDIAFLKSQMIISQV